MHENAEIAPQPRQCVVDGTRIAYTAAGSTGPATVLLHGYLGSHLTWRRVIPDLSRHARIIAVDWFGWGDSQCNPSLAYDYDSEVERLARVLDALGLERGTIAGHDYGGFLALGFAQRYPARVERLALLNTRAQGSFVPLWYALFGALGLWARTPGLGALLEALPLARIHRALTRRGLDAGIFDEASLASYVDWMSADVDGAAFFRRFYQGYRVAIRPELARGLADMTCPVSVIWGREDEYLDVGIARELAGRIPDARLVELPGIGHFVTEQAPQEVVSSLRELLAVPV